MGRRRAFDRDNVLMAAANAFRMHGYRDISIADLERITGLVSGSIYNAFGDKAGLFRAALEHYVHGFVAERVRRFAGEDATLDDLEGLFQSVLEPPLADGFGCLVTNSIIEFGREDGPAAEGIATTMALLENAFRSVLARELGPEAAARSTVQLITLYHGVLTLSRSRMPMAEISRAVQATFAQLKAQRPDRPSLTRKKRKTT
ncbi:MAG: TetR/AcrR family transcriptional regulator [Burkholderiaceae bacterium]|nr:TetR/AcrR family transcriptional regulator [Burkholderiaceae bacterium]